MQDSVQTKTAPRAIPFDTAKLDRLMEEAGLDVLLATSKHNVQYMLDAERAIFFDYMDALGISRYLPVVIYAKGAPDKAGYVGHRLETHQLVIDSMLEVIAHHGPGTTKRQLFDALRVAEAKRGLTFEYCLLASGSSHNRAPSEQRWEKGDVLSLDSGGNYHGYIGDLARMAVLGEPDSELKDLLAEIEAVQRAAFAVIKPGAIGGEIYVAAERALKETSQHDNTEFLAHGMGLVSHEAPR